MINREENLKDKQTEEENLVNYVQKNNNIFFQFLSVPYSFMCKKNQIPTSFVLFFYRFRQNKNRKMIIALKKKTSYENLNKHKMVCQSVKTVG